MVRTCDPLLRGALLQVAQHVGLAAVAADAALWRQLLAEPQKAVQRHKGDAVHALGHDLCQLPKGRVVLFGHFDEALYGDANDPGVVLAGDGLDRLVCGGDADDLLDDGEQRRHVVATAHLADDNVVRQVVLSTRV